MLLTLSPSSQSTMKTGIAPLLVAYLFIKLSHKVAHFLKQFVNPLHCKVPILGSINFYLKCITLRCVEVILLRCTFLRQVRSNFNPFQLSRVFESNHDGKFHKEAHTQYENHSKTLVTC